jgi:pantoate--beta-alanine ligase
MQVVQTVQQMRQIRPDLGPVAFVPTMGALHAGHVALIERAQQFGESVVVSIFVNPTQFAPHEDLDRYPRPIADDLARCEAAGVAAVFNPTVEQLYPPNQMPVQVNVPDLATILEGEARPHFFGGVCRVCAKLFNIVRPEVACFGMKDFQQLRVIEAMVAGLAMDLRIVPCPTVRESDGLAMSSRNVYLDADQRHRALALSAALTEARQMVVQGVDRPQAIEAAMGRILADSDLQVDYAVVRDARTLGALSRIPAGGHGAVALIAGRVDAVRLIDNLPLDHSL